VPERTPEEILERRLDYYRERLTTSMERRNIPDYMRGGIERWVIEGQPGGHFLMAVFENNLMEACKRADETNQQCLWNYTAVMYNDFPIDAKGSREICAKWRELGGLRGAIRNEIPPIRVAVDDEVVGANGRPVEE